MIEKIKAESRTGPYGSVFFDVDIRVKETGKPVKTISKTLSFKEFVKWLSGSLKEKETPSVYPVGKVPKGYVDACIVSDGSFSIAVQVPGAKRQVIFMGQPMSCAYPPLLFMFRVDKTGVLKTSKCFALKDEEIKEDTLLWYYPYGHVSTSGSICMGSVPKGNINNLTDAESVIENFFLGEDQGHSYTNDKTLLNVPLGKLFSIMEQAEQFPKEYLNGDAKTFGKEWEEFK